MPGRFERRALSWFFSFILIREQDQSYFRRPWSLLHHRRASMSPTEAISEGSDKIPLLELPPIDDEGNENGDLKAVSAAMVQALETSGFLLIKSPSLGTDLQASALLATEDVLLGRHTNKRVEAVIDHPSDPKVYIMLDSLEDIADKCGASTSEASPTAVLSNYWNILEGIKRQILTYLAIGLGLEDSNFLVKLHSQNKSVLRLLHYPTPSETSTDTGKEPIIRARAHSDYGSITLLLTDGVPGLEALIDDEWTPVPHIEGALVVNIGSLLQDWTNGKLLATLHRVVSISEENHGVRPRTSLAFFADPDPDVSMDLKRTEGDKSTRASEPTFKTVAEYIEYRSGGTGRERKGVCFSEEEAERAKRARTSGAEDN